MTPEPNERYLSRRFAAEGQSRLRPMTSGEILDQSMRVYRTMGWSFLRLSLVPSLFCLAAIAFVSSYVWPALQSTSDPGSVSTQLTETAMLLVTALLIGAPLFLTGVGYATASVVQMVFGHLVGLSVSEEKARLGAGEQLPRLVLVLIRELLVALGGPAVGLLFVFLGGWMATVTPESSAVAGVLSLAGIFIALAGCGFLLYVVATRALVVPVALLEGIHDARAVQRSRDLMKGSRYHDPGTSTVFSLFFLLLFVALIIVSGSYITLDLVGVRSVVEASTYGLPAQGLLLMAIDLLPAFLMVWTLIPIWAATITVVYFERRIRLEGYDIDVLSSRMR